MTASALICVVTLPALLLPHVGVPRHSGTLAAAPFMSAAGGDEGVCRADSLQQPLALAPAHRAWRQKAKNAGVALAAAALVAVPRGPARAASLPSAAGSSGGGATTSREASAECLSQRAAAEQPLAFLGMRREKNVKPPLPPRSVRANEIDMGAIVSKKMTSRYTDRKFIFSEELVRKTELDEELDELDEIKTDKAFEKTLSTVSLYGTVAGGLYAGTKGLQAIERAMKKQELRDIEEERELTGEYVSIDAGDVKSVIDPKTGKNMTVTTARKDVDPLAPVEPKEAAPVPWLLKVLGLGDKPADDDDFWAPT